MTKIPFTKPFTTSEEQVALLKERGMIIDDIQIACFYLRHISYYRLSAYWLPFKKTSEINSFQPKTYFSTVIHLYNFDRELRLLIIDALERIEISIRGQWTYYMANFHGVHSYSDKNFAVKDKLFEKNLVDIKRYVDRSDEIFIRHSKMIYNDELPAIWKVSEVISFGLLSKLYTNLKPMPTRRAIAKIYYLDDELLSSWLHHLTYIRNLCAHHSRLWNREFINTPKLPKNKPLMLSKEFILNSRKLYNTLVILLYFMDIITTEHTWRNNLKFLLNNNDTQLASMGFPSDWKNRAIWQSV